MLRKIAVVVAALTTSLFTLPFHAWAAGITPTEVVGTAPAAAATLASRAYPKGASTAILTSALVQNLADAVTAAPLSAVLKAPILLTTGPMSVGSQTLAEIKTLHVQKVILIGAVDNAAIRSQLPHGMSVVGYAGSTRYRTSAVVFKHVELAGGNPKTVFYASANDANLTDALTVDDVAAATKSPILLLPPSGKVPLAYSNLIKSSQTSYVVGAAVSYHAPLPNEVNLAGVDRFTTATLVNQRFFHHPTGIVVTNAGYLLDALVASPYAGRQSMPLVMVGTHVIPGPSYDYLAQIASGVHSVLTVGNAVAMSPLMVRAVVQLMESGGSPGLGEPR